MPLDVLRTVNPTGAGRPNRATRIATESGFLGTADLDDAMTSKHRPKPLAG